MNNEQKPLSAEEGLGLISQIIQQSKGKLMDNSFYFLLWGWTIALCEFGMYALMKLTDYPHPYIVWLLPIPAWIVTMIYGHNQGRTAKVTSYYDRVNMWLWISFGIAILPVIIFMSRINFQINPIIMLITALPTFITGIMVRFKPLIIGGICFYVAAILCFVVDYQTQYLVSGIAIICGYLIPGYLLRSASRHV